MITINLFLESIENNKSPDTISGYSYDLLRFEKYLNERTGMQTNYPLENLTDEQVLLRNLNQADIIGYLRYLENTNKKNTINRKISVLKKYFLFLYDNQIIDKDLTRSLRSYKIIKNERKVLSINECNLLINSINGRYKLRDQLIIFIFLLCGLHVNELVSIEKSSIYENYMILNKDTENSRKAYINDALKSILSAFLNYDRVSTSKYLFSGKNGGHLSKRTVQHIIKTNLIRNDFYQEGKTTELLKNTCFSLLSEYCAMNLLEIKKYLGYKNNNNHDTTNFKTSNRVNVTLLNKIPITLKK